MGTSTNDHDPFNIYVEFDSAGIYTVEISGRSDGHAIDRMVLYHSDIFAPYALNLSLPESPRSIISSTGREVIELNLFRNPVDGFLEI